MKHQTPPEIAEQEKALRSDKEAVADIVQCLDAVFERRGISDNCYLNPSHGSTERQKVCGVTHIYLHHVRIGRKVNFGDSDLYYGRKFSLFAEPFEIVPFEAATDVFGFITKRMEDSILDYLSIHHGNERLNADIKDGIVVSLEKIGFDNAFKMISKGEPLTMTNLELIIDMLEP